MQRIIGYLPGLILVAVITWVSEYLGAFVPLLGSLVIAIFIGILIRNTYGLPATFAKGSKLAAKQLLELGIVLLGATFSFTDIAKVGPKVLVIIALCLGLGIIVGQLISRAMGLSRRLGILIAVGNAICGNSAIAAVAPVIKAEKEEITLSIAFTGVIGVFVVVLLPFLAPVVGLDNTSFGIWAGTTVYAVPQVLAASFRVSEVSGQIGTIVKLVRVLFIGPIVLLFSVLEGRRSGQGKAKQTVYVPWFVVGFIILGIVGTFGAFSPAMIALIKRGSHLLMVMSMASMGLDVDIKSAIKVGPRVAGAVSGSILFIALLSLTLLKLL
ncbi:MAG: YeiH family protein [Bacillota bacterium]